MESNETDSIAETNDGSKGTNGLTITWGDFRVSSAKRKNRKDVVWSGNREEKKS